MGYNRAKKEMKKLLFVIAIVVGFATNANAQFFEFIQKAAETTSRVMDATKDVKETVNSYSNSRSSQSSTPSYKTLGSVRAIRFITNGTSTKTLEIVKDEDGLDKALVGGKLYQIYDNYSYDSYCTNSKNSDYYRYYVNIGGTYYFNW